MSSIATPNVLGHGVQDLRSKLTKNGTWHSQHMTNGMSHPGEILEKSSVHHPAQNTVCFSRQDTNVDKNMVPLSAISNSIASNIKMRS